jgi:hypothetical protein
MALIINDNKNNKTRTSLRLTTLDTDLRKHHHTLPLRQFGRRTSTTTSKAKQTKKEKKKKQARRNITRQKDETDFS